MHAPEPTPSGALAATGNVLDDAAMTPRHWKIVAGCSGGPFLDGYLLSIVGVALTGATAELQLSSSAQGLAGAAALFGLFIGSLILGPITDRIGRRTMYTVDLLVMVVSSAMCLFISTGWQLILLRLIVGLAVGADYPIATSLLTEWLPSKRRGAILGWLSTVWLIGAVVAYLVGFLFTSVWGPGSWRWMLATGAVAGAIVMALRMGSHESPRWLINNGKLDQARIAVSAVLGRSVTDDELSVLAEKKDTKRSPLSVVLRKPYLRRTLFCGLTWMAFAIPQFALFTYGPIILSQFGMHGGTEETLGQILLNMGFLIGTIPALYWVERFGRRPLMLWTFALSALALVPLGLWPGAGSGLILTFFFVFCFFNGAGTILVFIYPNELFPTGVRATAVGTATAISRIGAAIGTYLIPLSLSGLGTGPTMLLGVAITAIGFLISVFWAEETRGRNLTEAASAPDLAKVV